MGIHHNSSMGGGNGHEKQQCWLACAKARACHDTSDHYLLDHQFNSIDETKTSASILSYSTCFAVGLELPRMYCYFPTSKRGRASQRRRPTVYTAITNIAKYFTAIMHGGSSDWD